MSEDHVGFLMQDSHRDCGYAQQFPSVGVYPKSMAGYWAATLKLSESLGIFMQEQQFTAVVRPEDGWFIAQALEVDVASQGESPDGALDNLAEALELHFEPPRPTVLPEIHNLRVKVGAA